MVRGLTEVVYDLMDNFLEGAHLGVDQKVGLSIDGFALGKEVADALLGVFSLQQGPVGLVFDTFPDRIG